MGFPAEVRRLRSDGENVLAQAEREKQALTQTLNAAQLEAQQALHKAISEHQEEVERLVSEKVRRFIGPVQALDIGLLTSSADGCSVFFGGGAFVKEVLRHSLLMEQESALRKLRQEMEDPLHRAERQREELQEELRNLQHDRDQSLLQAETEKQQVRFQPPKNSTNTAHHHIKQTQLGYFSFSELAVALLPLCRRCL